MEPIRQHHDGKGRLLLIGIGGLSWELIRDQLDRGNVPCLRKLMDQGICAKLAGLEPITSTPLWASIATGMRPEYHGVFQDGYGQSLSWGGDPHEGAWAVPCVWDVFEHHGMKGHVMGWPATGGRTLKNGGIRVSDEFLAPPPDKHPAADWMQRRIRPGSLYEEYKELLWSPNEFTSNDLRPFIPDMETVDLHEDDRPWRLARALSKTVSINACATYALQKDWDFAMIHLHGFENILQAFIQYQAPQLAGISDTVFKRYGQVVDETVRLFDQLMGVLVSMAGDDATVAVVSPYGFRLGKDRWVPERGKHVLHMESRIYPGFLALSGPAIKEDEWMFGAHLLDLVPTLLAARELPLPNHLQGKPLIHGFKKQPRLSVEPDRYAVKPAPSPSFTAFRKAGSSDADFSPEELQSLDNACRQAYYLLNAGDGDRALPILEKLSSMQPYRMRLVFERIQCLHGLDRNQEALGLLEEQEKKPLGGLRFREGLNPMFLPQFDLMKALLFAKLGRHDEANRQLEVAEHAGHGQKLLCSQIWIEIRSGCQDCIRYGFYPEDVESGQGNQFAGGLGFIQAP